MEKESKIKKGDVANRIIGYVLQYAKDHASEDGRLAGLSFNRAEIAAATGASVGYVSTVLTTKLSHVMATENDGNGWGILVDTIEEFETAVGKPPLTRGDIRVGPKGNPDMTVHRASHSGPVHPPKGYFG